MWHGLAKEFAKQGHEVTILAKAFPGQPETENRDGIRIVRWGGYGLTTSLAADLVKCFFYAVGAVRRMPAGDVVVTNDFWTPALLPRLRPDAGRVFLNANRYPKHQYWLYGKVAGISAASGEVASEIERQAPKLAGRIKVVPNAIDSCFLENEGDRLRLRLRLRNEEEKRSPLTVLYAGRIHPEKGIEILIEAWRLLRERWRKENFEGDRRKEIGPLKPSPAHPSKSLREIEEERFRAGIGDRESLKGENTPHSYLLSTISHAQARLRIVGPWRKEQGGGGAEYLESLKKKAEGVEWGEPIFDRAKLAEEYRGADLFVYPSLAESGEAMPLGPVEAMGCGAVPVVSDLKVFGEYLVPGKNGWTFNHRERGAENLAAVLANALSADLTKMREEARRTAGKFSPARIAELHLEFFQAVGKKSD